MRADDLLVATGRRPVFDGHDLEAAGVELDDDGRPVLSETLRTTGADVCYLDHEYEERDVLLFGRESAGVPARVADAAEARLLIPMREGLRSLNVAMAAAMAAGEAIRQTQHRKPG